MRKITKVEHTPSSVPKRKRVAAYARVSKDTERLMHSISAQVSYYSELIQSNPEWEFAGVYADFGISGTGVNARDEYLRLLSGCEAGKIDLVITKSISRFARNTVDMLAGVRHLKEIGVEVQFEKEHISSFSKDGELMMTIIASFAQEEAQSISENIKWSLRKRYAEGEDIAANKKVYGYRHDGEKYIIQEDEAEIVRYIFKSTADGVAPHVIKNELAERGIKTWRGYDFDYSNLYTMLRNEIYIGDRRMQKSFIENPLKHNKVKNRGQLPQYYISDCHEPIIDKETFNKVQEILKRRVEAVPTYPFTKKIVCGVCGCSYNRKKSIVKGKTYVSWICRRKREKGVTCRNINYNEENLEQISAQMMGLDEFDGDAFEETINKIIVLESGDLQFEFKDGSVKVWERPPKQIKKEEPKPPVNLFDRKIYCGSCGRRFGRSMSNTNDGGHLFWFCRAKHAHGITCDSVNYADLEIREIFCRVMKKKEFDDEYFSKTVDRVVIHKTGSIDFHLKSGKVKQFEAFKLRINVHKTTSTDEFAGKIICSHCGNTYHRYSCRGKYMYWRCSGKSRLKTKCVSHDFADCNLRDVSAYIMGDEEFDAEKFENFIDRITVLEDGSLKYTFKDGRTKTWERM